MVRFPFLPKVTLQDIVSGQGNAYKVTGTPPQPAPPKPAPAQPEGIEALQRAIESCQARQAQIVGELAEAETQYTDAALLWDTQQDIDARERMNGAAARRTALEAESLELVAELPRLQRRLQSARLAVRAKSVEEDLASLPAIVAEFQDLDAEWRALAVDLVQMYGDLARLREGYRAAVRRITAGCQEVGQPAPPVNLGALALPFFSDTWLDGAPRSLQAARVRLGVVEEE